MTTRRSIAAAVVAIGLVAGFTMLTRGLRTPECGSICFEGDPEAGRRATIGIVGIVVIISGMVIGALITDRRRARWPWP